MNRVKMRLDVLPSVCLKDHGVKAEKEVDSIGVGDNEDDDIDNGDGLGRWLWPMEMTGYGFIIA